MYQYISLLEISNTFRFKDTRKIPLFLVDSRDNLRENGARWMKKVLKYTQLIVK